MRKLEKLNGILTIVMFVMLILSCIVPGKAGIIFSILVGTIAGFTIGCDVQKKVYNKEQEIKENE